MNTLDPNGPQTPDLGALVTDAVADVEPSDRITEIRTRTRRARRTRHTWYAGGASLLAAAATVTAFAVIGPGDDGADPDPVDRTTVPDPVTGTTEVYYVGPGPDGPDAPEEVLYRYPEAGDDPIALLMATPSDPDYRTAWPEGSLESYAVEGSQIVAVVGDDAPLDDELARQQLVYTLQGVTDTDLPVGIRYADGREIAIDPIEAGPELEVLSHMLIDSPLDGAAVSGRFTATGMANSFEGTVFCQLLDDAGSPVWEESTTAGGLLDDVLNAWTMRVSLARVAPGSYTFRCQTDDPTAGTEGRGADVDTRTVVVEAASDGQEPPTSAPNGDSAASVYYVGDTPAGPSLYGETHQVGQDELSDLIRLATSDSAIDPDYRTAWPTTLEFASFDGIGDEGSFGVVVPATVLDRPAEMTEREAVVAVQQVVYTLQERSGSLAGVRFYLDSGDPAPSVLGIPVDASWMNRLPELEVLSHLSISEPSHGSSASGSVVARGVANGFEGTVSCRLVDELGDGGWWWQGATIASGSGSRLFPWDLTVDLDGVEPGPYSLICETDEPNDEADPYVDTRTITVE